MLYTGQLTTLKASLQLASSSTASSAVNVVLAKDQVIDFADRSTTSVEDDRTIAVTTGTGQALQLTHDGERGELMRASGGMQLLLAGFVHVGGTLAIEKSSQTLKLADGKSVQTDMLTVGGTDLQMFVGVGGPYRTDTNGDALVSSEDEVNTGAIGLSAVGGEFALGLFYEKTLGTPRNWVALQASLDEVGLVGVPGITAFGRDIAVALNRVDGIATGSSVNTQVIDFAAKPLDVSTGYGTTTQLDMAGSQGQLLRASGGFEFNLGDFVYASGTLGFEKSATTITLANGSDVLVDSLTVGGSGLSGFVGVGGAYHVDSNGDGTLTSADTPNAGARGFVLTHAEFGLALLSPQEVTVLQSDSAAVKTLKQNTLKLGALDWMGLEFSADQVGFVGGGDLTIQAKNLSVEVNQVSGLSDSDDATQWVVDFAGRPLDVITGTGSTRELDIDGDKGPLIRASGSVEIAAGDFFYVGGDLGFEKSTRDLVLEDGSTVSHDVMTVGGSNLQAFAGINGGPLTDTNEDGKIDGEDLPGLDAIGFSLSGVEFALVVASEREVVRINLAEALEWQDMAVSDTVQVAVSGGKKGAIYLSKDKGQTWSEAESETVTLSGRDYSAVTVAGETIVATVRDGGVLISTDAGATWAVSGAHTDRYSDVAVLAENVIVTLDTQTLRSFDAFQLAGTFRLGDTLTVRGVADRDVAILLTSNEIRGGTSTAEQNRERIATKLRAAINAASGSRAVASGTASHITLSARAEGFGATQVIVKSSGGRVEGTQSVATQSPQIDAFWLQGTWAAGEKITLKGVAKTDLVYTVVSNDLTAKGDGKGGTASSAQVLKNLTTKLTDLIKATAKDVATTGALVTTSYVAADGLIYVGSLVKGQAYKLEVEAKSAKGSVMQTRAQTYPTQQGNVSLGDDTTVGGKQVWNAWANQAGFSRVANAQWSAVAAFDEGRSMLVASSRAADGAAPGSVYLVDLASDKGLPATYWPGTPGSGVQVHWSLPYNADWRAVAASGQGEVLMAAAHDGSVYLARTDADVWDWGQVLGRGQWTSLAASEDGQTLVAASTGPEAAIWVSSDSGRNWRVVAGSKGYDWHSVSVMADGKRVLAAGEQGLVSFTVVADRQDATRIALEAEATSARLFGVPDVTLAVRDVAVSINLADKATDRVIDFANSDFSVLTGPESARLLSMDGANHEMLSVSAGITLALGDYVYLDGTAAFEKRSDSVTLADGSKVAVDALTVGAANVQAFAGLGGAYRVDSNADGVVDGIRLVIATRKETPPTPVISAI